MRSVTFTTQGALGKSSLREANERLVLNLVLRQPGISRVEIVRRTGLSSSAITGIVDRLMRNGLVSEEKIEHHTQIGRRPTGLHLQTRSRLVVGVEITPFEGVAVLADLAGNAIEQRSIAANPDPEAFLLDAHAAIAGLIPAAQSEVLGVAVSLPGTLEPETGHVIAATNLRWRNVDAIRLLKQDLKLPFYWDNNSNLAALAERWFRPGPPLQDFIFITLRGGLGSGLIVNGAVVQGAAARAGEFGHMILYPEGRKCLCGNTGCWEEYASDRALCRMYAERGGERTDDALHVVERARQGDQTALDALQETAHNLALGCVTLIMGLNPGAIVVDDFAAVGWDLIEPSLWKTLRERVPDYWLSGTQILPSKEAVHSSLSGAVALVLSRYFTSFTHEDRLLPSPVTMHL